MVSSRHTKLGQRIQGLRIRAGLTQKELAKKARIPYTTLTKVEIGAIKNPTIKVVSKIASALSIPVEYITEQNELVETLTGRDSISQILDDVYETLKEYGGEVFISGIDEQKFLEADKEAIIAHIKRLAQAQITERLLARENDSFFFSGPQSKYRWVPEHLFNPTPIYVYGDKVAIIVWGPPQQVIIIKNAALADAYRKQFLFIWERAKIPPNAGTMIDERNRLENLVIQRYGGRISSVTESDRKTFYDFLKKEKTQTYGNSWFYLGQAANGIGTEKMGLKFFDGEMLATIGIFNRASLGGGWHFHIVRPIGEFDQKKILSIAKKMLEMSGHPVFVKKLTKTQQSELLKIGFSSIESYPWHAQALEEDDTFPEQILDIEEVLRSVEASGNRNLKDKYQRFAKKFAQHIRVENISEANQQTAVRVVKTFFEYLEIKELHISQPTDYDNIIFHPPLGKNGKTYFAEIMYIDNEPVALWAAEPIGENTAGLFANIALYQKATYLSEYLLIHVLKTLKAAGYKKLNLGGSETSGLFQFKEKLSPETYNKMQWVVYKI